MIIANSQFGKVMVGDPIRWVIDTFVPGIPKPQGSKRAWVNPRTGRAHMSESSGKELRDWRTDVRHAVAEAGIEMIVGEPVTVWLAFVMKRPLATPKSRTPPAIKKPDLDKLVRGIFDSLSGTIYSDDSQVTSISASKRIANVGEQPGVQIMVGIAAG
jgi:Holliday junction resolvase RusA-like endonuclease